MKSVWAHDNFKFINDWVKSFRYAKSVPNSIGTITGVGSDFQHNNTVCIEEAYKRIAADNHHWQITKNNLIESSIYFSVRKSIPPTWLNDRDLFLHPSDTWKTDKEFQNDCLTFTIFSNVIQSKFGVNRWIPFTESEVNAADKFESSFMTDFINGRITPDKRANASLFETDAETGIYDNTPRQFSAEATAVFDAGRELWKYYHSQKDINVNASYYDIREYFQGRNYKGRMNTSSMDAHYTELIANLRQKLNVLASKIAPKVYEHGFLKK